MRKFSWALLSMLIFVHGALAQKKRESKPKAAITFQTLYNFTGGDDGCCIFGGVARDKAGNLYGVAYLSDDLSNYGDLWEFTPGAAGYTFHILQSFSSTDGECAGTPTIDAAGNIFGVCGGFVNGGTLWEYSHGGQFFVLHTFYAPTEGDGPADTVAFDSAGNIYGTTHGYGPNGGGTLWEYSPSGRLTVLHAFALFYGSDGAGIPAGPRLDSTGKLWGVAVQGPDCYACGYGTIWNYDLNSGTFTVVSNLDTTDIKHPQSRLTLNAAGNLYGTAYGLGIQDCGVVFELSPGNNYQPVIVYHFSNIIGCEPLGRVTFDSQGNLFGATYYGGAGGGVAYELKLVNGVWKETVLHTFIGTDGTGPDGGLVSDGAGNWFGTTAYGGSAGQGTVFEISGVQ
jgi:uncharacterized repeat protein (TIGR03803 family)